MAIVLPVFESLQLFFIGQMLQTLAENFALKLPGFPVIFCNFPEGQVTTEFCKSMLKSFFPYFPCVAGFHGLCPSGKRA